MENENEGEAGAQDLYKKRLQALQLEMKKKELLRSMLSPSAYERMMNVRMSSPELYEKVVGSLAYLAQSGKTGTGKISDSQLYELLSKMTERRETSIEFRSK
ncbi:DNA-binding protein [uncultured archaeon]|nr:DNA-binding protein [uncultured archaeon]